MWWGCGEGLDVVMWSTGRGGGLGLWCGSGVVMGNS